LDGRSSEYYPLPLLFNEPQPNESLTTTVTQPEIAALDAVIASMMLNASTTPTHTARQRRPSSPPTMVVHAVPVLQQQQHLTMIAQKQTTSKNTSAHTTNRIQRITNTASIICFVIKEGSPDTS
jgi:hypothetical protein